MNYDGKADSVSIRVSASPVATRDRRGYEVIRFFLHLHTRARNDDAKFRNGKVYVSFRT